MYVCRFLIVVYMYRILVYVCMYMYVCRFLVVIFIYCMYVCIMYV